MYRGKRRTEVPPHLFAISDGAYTEMLTSEYNQPVLSLYVIHYELLQAGLYLFITQMVRFDQPFGQHLLLLF